MRLSFDEVDLDSKELEKFLSDVEADNIFHTIQWFRVISESGDGELKMVLASRDGNRVVLLPLFYRRVGPIMWLERAPSTPYLFPLMVEREGGRQSSRSSYIKQVFTEVARYIESRFHTAELFDSPGLNDMRPFVWRGWQTSVRYTLISKIGEIYEMWEGLSPKVRSIIRKGERDGLIYNEKGEIGIVECLIGESFRRQGRRPPLSKGFFRSFKRFIIDAGLGTSPVVTNRGGEPQAGALVATYGGTSYYISAGLSEDAHPSAGSCLLWNIMRGLSGSVEYLDLCGANIKSIAHFKESFEGELVPFYALYYQKSRMHSNIVNILKRLYFPL